MKQTKICIGEKETNNFLKECEENNWVARTGGIKPFNLEGSVAVLVIYEKSEHEKFCLCGKVLKDDEETKSSGVCEKCR